MHGIPVVPASTPSRCGLATWSLVLGILALVLSVICIGPLFGIPAVICGHVALGRIKRAAGMLTGDGPALGGLITGYISIALIPVIGLLSAIAIPNFVRARDVAMQNACINNLRIIDAAKQQWALEKGTDASATPTMGDISPYLGRSQQTPTCLKGGHYEVNPVRDRPTCTVPGHELPK
jgi:hypothetical protein